MGKKIKKDDKGPPDDVFEPLQIEGKAAATAVLMLESPEEDVLSKACEAIYKFLEKGEENKKTLLDLNVLEPLLKLVQHEDRTVHRNACMALGVMASHHDVRKALRKQEDTIPAMITLLSPEEDSVVHEFAALCLSALAVDFSSKVRIYEQDGLDPLIQCLSSSDPDVQKNAIETISLMLQDYQTKAAIRDLNGFPPMLELLKSDYPVVQHLALVSLQRATEDAENRAALRELEAINKLIDFVGKPEWNDLHVFAVVVLANCLEDSESMELIKENGGLTKLVAYITDTQPPEEEEKSKGKKDKGASRAGKKGKGGDDAESNRGTPKPSYYSDYDDHATTAVTSVTTAMGRQSSMRSVIRMASTTGATRGQSRTGSRSTSRAGGSRSNSRVDGRPGLPQRDSHRLSIIPSGGSEMHPDDFVATAFDEKHKSKGEADPIIPTLPEVKEHAAKAIARAAKNADNRKILHEQQAEKMMIHLLTHEDPNVQVAAAQGLGVMSENLLSREAIGQWDGIEPLIKMCKNDNADVREAASMALANLTSSNMNNCNEVLRFHGIDPVVTMLKDTREQATANAAVVLTNMAPDENMRYHIQQAGVIPALIDPLQSCNPVVQSKASLAVAAFCGDAEARATFRENEGIEHLVKLLESNNDDVRRSSSWAVSVCAMDEPTAMEISRFGGLRALQEVQLSSTRKNAFTDVAFDKLLNSNLSAKYSLKGVLGPNNLINDGFIDVGQLRPNTQFLSVEDYCNQEINQRRPVLLVNAKPEKPSTPPPPQQENELVEKSSRSSVTGRSSRTGRESKAKSRVQKEKEDKPKEEEPVQKEPETTQEVPPFSLPGDSSLVRYIEEVQDRVAPLPSTKDQVVALAQYVSDKMGGAIDRGQVANFSWELPISQIKFEIKSNVIPIGMIKQGIHYHRALLFKTLADRIAVHCSLVRGEYNRAWNEVLITDDDDTPGAPKFPPKAFIVDLVHQPGCLMKSDSSDAISYQQL